MSDSIKEIRCFIGIPVSFDLATMLNKLARGWREENSFPDFKWVKKTDYHLTLHFIGEIQPSELQKVMRSLKEKQLCRDLPIVDGEITLSVQGFPNSNSAKFIVAEFPNNPTLNALQKSIGDVLREKGIDVDTEPFRPHISLARLKPKHTPPPIHSLTKLNAVVQLEEYAVFKSLLTPEGSHYEVIETIT